MFQQLGSSSSRVCASCCGLHPPPTVKGQVVDLQLQAPAACGAWRPHQGAAGWPPPCNACPLTPDPNTDMAPACCYAACSFLSRMRPAPEVPCSCWTPWMLSSASRRCRPGALPRVWAASPHCRMASCPTWQQRRTPSPCRAYWRQWVGVVACLLAFLVVYFVVHFEISVCSALVVAPAPQHTSQTPADTAWWCASALSVLLPACRQPPLPAVRELAARVQAASPLGQYAAPLAAVRMLVSIEPVAKALVGLPTFRPDLKAGTGRALQLPGSCWLGPCFSVSCYPDELIKAQPDVYASFAGPNAATRTQVRAHAKGGGSALCGWRDQRPGVDASPASCGAHATQTSGTAICVSQALVSLVCAVRQCFHHSRLSTCRR